MQNYGNKKIPLCDIISFILNLNRRKVFLKCLFGNTLVLGEIMSVNCN